MRIILIILLIYFYFAYLNKFLHYFSDDFIVLSDASVFAVVHWTVREKTTLAEQEIIKQINV